MEVQDTTLHQELQQHCLGSRLICSRSSGWDQQRWWGARPGPSQARSTRKKETKETKETTTARRLRQEDDISLGAVLTGIA